ARLTGRIALIEGRAPDGNGTDLLHRLRLAGSDIRRLVPRPTLPCIRDRRALPDFPQPLDEGHQRTGPRRLREDVPRQGWRNYAGASAAENKTGCGGASH